MSKLWESIAGDAAGAAVGAGLGMVLGGAQDKRQLEQQKKLQQQQIEGNKEMARYNQSLQMDMWNKTNYGAQVDHLKAAGLNPGLMYGMGGGGGATTGGGGGAGVQGGTADGAAAGTNSAIQMGLMLAQKQVMESQAKKNEAEANEINGVKTQDRQQDIQRKTFENELNKAIGVPNMASRYETANQKLELSWSKELAEYNSWVAGGFAGKATDDPKSPIAKAIRAGLEYKVEELEGARINNDIKRAEKIIKDFEAEMAESGLSPNSPWYVKFLGDLIGGKEGLDKWSVGSSDTQSMKNNTNGGMYKK